MLLIARSGATVESLGQYCDCMRALKPRFLPEQMTLLERDQAAAYFADIEARKYCWLLRLALKGVIFNLPVIWCCLICPPTDTLEQRIGRL